MQIVGMGVDITEVRRLQRAVEKWGDSFLNRVFTRQELANAHKRGRFFQHLAGRFAAKEAVFKALGNKTLGWQDIVVLNKEDGSPFCRILKDKGKGLKINLSISHVKTYAVASAIVTK